MLSFEHLTEYHSIQWLKVGKVWCNKQRHVHSKLTDQAREAIIWEAVTSLVVTLVKLQRSTGQVGQSVNRMTQIWHSWKRGKKITIVYIKKSGLKFVKSQVETEPILKKLIWSDQTKNHHFVQNAKHCDEISILHSTLNTPLPLWDMVVAVRCCVGCYSFFFFLYRNREAGQSCIKDEWWR